MGKKKIKEASGAITGVPVLGAMGGGDDYKQKIGRPTRPWFQTNGIPSAAADAGWASWMSRVNMGYDPAEEEFPMFLDQDEEIYDIEDEENIYLRTRKVPKNFRVMQPIRKGISEKNMKDKYSLMAVLDDSPLEETIDKDPMHEGAWGDVVTDILGDAGMGTLGLIPGLDIGVLFPMAIGVNITQLRDSTHRGEKLACQLLRDNTPMGAARLAKYDGLADEMRDTISDMLRDMMDMIQRSFEAIPDPGASEAGSFAGGRIQNLKTLLSALSRYGRQAKAWLRTSRNPVARVTRMSGIMGPSPNWMRSPEAIMANPRTAARVLGKDIGWITAHPDAAFAALTWFQRRGGWKTVAFPGRKLGTSGAVVVIARAFQEFIVELYDMEILSDANVPPETRFVLFKMPSVLILLSDMVEGYYEQREHHQAENPPPLWDHFPKNPYNPELLEHAGSLVPEICPGGDRPITGPPRVPEAPTDSDCGNAYDCWLQSQEGREWRESVEGEEELQESIQRSSLRSFILEAALESDDSDEETAYRSSLGGYAPYPTIAMMGMEVSPEEEEVLADYIVNYKTDVGYNVSQAAEEDSQLREFVRDHLEEIFDHVDETKKRSKKKGKKRVAPEEDPDLEEYSSAGGAGSVGNMGWVGPLKSPTKKQRQSLVRIAKASFGGG